MNPELKIMLVAVKTRAKKIGAESVSTVAAAREAGITNARARLLLKTLNQTGHVERAMMGHRAYWRATGYVPEKPPVCHHKKLHRILPTRFKLT